MIGPRVIKETENYRVIESRGTYKVQQNCGAWRTYGEYKTERGALKLLERLESYNNKK